MSIFDLLKEKIPVSKIHRLFSQDWQEWYCALTLSELRLLWAATVHIWVHEPNLVHAR